MNLILQSCEYRGDAAEVSKFLFFNCADAIRRPLWIRRRERLTIEATGYVRDRNSAVPARYAWYQVMSSAPHPASHPTTHPA